MLHVGDGRKNTETKKIPFGCPPIPSTIRWPTVFRCPRTPKTSRTYRKW